MVNFTNCARCFNHSSSHIMSMFNEDLLCMLCKTKETNHPEYKKASDAEIQAIKDGNNNFKGIGKPADL